MPSDNVPAEKTKCLKMSLRRDKIQSGLKIWQLSNEINMPVKCQSQKKED
jgi:hypothetical protein